ncbi:MAG TPA: hypothetical protein VIJ23_14490 [Mycobacterium sp.]
MALATDCAEPSASGRSAGAGWWCADEHAASSATAAVILRMPDAIAISSP